jgi:hypothetical protein
MYWMPVVIGGLLSIKLLVPHNIVTVTLYRRTHKRPLW